MSPKPRTLKYAEALGRPEQRIVDALPEIINALIGQAKAGDLKAAAYLCDRILGRPTGARIAPAEDCERPYDEAAFRLDQEERDKSDESRWFIAGLGRVRDLSGANGGT
jgi:hypothetical protein